MPIPIWEAERIEGCQEGGRTPQVLLHDVHAGWLGNATALKGHPKLGRLYLLLGEPRLESHRPAYEKAKNLLLGRRRVLHHRRARRS